MHSLSHVNTTHNDTDIRFNYAFYEKHLQIQEEINWPTEQMTCGNTSGVIGLSNFNKHDQLFKRGILEVYFAF
jgi:hypothetical protein